MIDQATLQYSASKNYKIVCLPSGSSSKELGFVSETAKNYGKPFLAEGIYWPFPYSYSLPVQIDASSVINSFKIGDESSLIPLDVELEFGEVIEDQYDLAFIAAHKDEPTIPFAEVRKRLREDGLL
jgi:hypothetical protein